MLLTIMSSTDNNTLEPRKNADNVGLQLGAMRVPGSLRSVRDFRDNLELVSTKRILSTSNTVGGLVSKPMTVAGMIMAERC